MNAAGIIDACIAQSGTDASRATLLSLLNERYQEQVSRSRWLLETVSLGNTVAGTADYSLPDTVIEVLSLRVGSYRWGEVGPKDYWDLLSSGTGNWTGRGSYAPTYSSTGGTSISLWPAPTTSGVAITLLASVSPTDLTDSSGAAGTPVTPVDLHGSLLDGLISLVLLRIDERPDLAIPFEERFNAATERLRRRKNSRVGGEGMQALVKGVHWTEV